MQCKKIVTCIPVIRYQVKHQKGITTMNNITALKDEELNDVQGGSALVAATAVLVIGGAVAVGTKIWKKYKESH